MGGKGVGRRWTDRWKRRDREIAGNTAEFGRVNDTDSETEIKREKEKESSI